MKKIYSLILALLISAAAFSQNISCDNIIYKNGEELSVQVIEISESIVKYKKCDNIDGPTYSEDILKVFMIKYKNGTKDIFNQTEYVNKVENKTSIETSSVISNATLNKSEVSIGFRIGIQRVTVGNSNSTLTNEYGTRPGLLLGFTTFIPVGKKIDIRPSIIYTSKGASYIGNLTNPFNDDLYLALNYIEIPVDVAFKLGNGGFALSIGPYLAFLMKAKDYNLDGDEVILKDYYEGVDFGLNFGASYLIADKVNLDLRYGGGLIDISTDWLPNDAQVNEALQFSIGMQF